MKIDFYAKPIDDNWYHIIINLSELKPIENTGLKYKLFLICRKVGKKIARRRKYVY